jgi:CubicO group peptidase (beta-lactamase class C family)
VSLELEGEPAEFGFDVARLKRIPSYFDEFVDSGRVAGWLATISRADRLVWVGSGGFRDREQSLAVTDDTVWRFFSMIKPLTAVAAMMLYEEGRFDLNDDVGRWIDELREPRVYVGGPAMAPQTRPATEPVRVHHLLTHTAGFTYDFQHLNPVDALYRAKGYDAMSWKFPAGIDLAGAVRDWCSVPLLFEPGTAWNYSVAYEILGRLIEIWSGQRLDEFFRQRILDPLGMTDTDWHCPPEKVDRLARLYVNFNGQAVPIPQVAPFTEPPALFLGGGGLVGTASDFQRFMSLLCRGGELGGTSLLNARTVSLMTKNHLPGGQTLAESVVRGSFSEVGGPGVGYGLGVSVVIDQVRNRSLVPEGSFGWGGAASTYFWVDPRNELCVALYSQLLPSSSYPWRRALQQLVYSAMGD